MNIHVNDRQRITAIKDKLGATARRLGASSLALREAREEAAKRYKWFGDTAHRAIVHGESLLRGMA